MVSNKEVLKQEGPMLIASNHPNSFLDAIILSVLFKRPVHSLARGDAFKKPFVASILSRLNMLPVFRTSEGVENLEHNFTTFEACKEIFKKDGIVLIFSEGSCINEWHLRPLKKGTARLALSCWDSNIPLKVLPCGINYQSFRVFGKNVQIRFGEKIFKEQLYSDETFGKHILHFNEVLKSRLQKLVTETSKTNLSEIDKIFRVKVSFAEKLLLFLPAVAGFLLNSALYYPVQKYIYKKAAHNDHYDSILMGILFAIYPFYLFLLSIIVSLLVGGYSWLLVWLILPFSAWSYVRLKKQF